MNNRLIRSLLPVLLVLLVMIWFVAHTGALRYLVLTMVLTLGLLQAPVRSKLCELKSSPWLWCLAVLTAWLLLQAAGWAWFPAETLAELRGQWLKGLLILLTGLTTGLALVSPSASRGLRLFYFGLAAVLAGQILGYGYSYVRFDLLPMNTVGVFGFKTEVSYLANVLFALTMAESFALFVRGRPALGLSGRQLLGFALLSILVVLLSGARNGVIGLLVLLFSTILLGSFFGARRLHGRARWWPLFALAGIVVLCVASWQLDPRWKRLNETLPYAFASETYPSWLDAQKYPFKHLSDGMPLDGSAYERVAFLTVGLKAAWHLPGGIGFTRKAFSHVVERQFGQPSRHAHSGLVEWLLAMGWPGFALWAAFLACLLRSGWARFVAMHSSVGLMMVFLVSGFAGRMLIENITRDTTLEIFLFLLGLLLASLHYEQAARQLQEK